MMRLLSRLISGLKLVHPPAGTYAWARMEALEDRRLMSATPPVSIGVIGRLASQRGIQSAAAHAVHHTLHLHGTMSGTFIVGGPLIPDAGLDYTFTGSGAVQPLGTSTMVGDIATPGLIAKNARASGQIILTAANGTVLLYVKESKKAKSAGGPSVVQMTFRFRIVSGTGAYANAKGHGNTTLQIDHTNGTFTVAFHGA